MFKLSRETEALLEDIERRIDPEVEEDFVKQWDNFLFGRFDGDYFSPMRKKTTAPAVDCKHVNINDAISDLDLMLRKEMLGVCRALKNGKHNLAIRANYGTCIIPSFFGAEIFMMPYETDTLPTNKPSMSDDWMRAMVEKGIPDVTVGYGAKVFEFAQMCQEVFEKYPKIKKYVTIYHPDAQGPLDICELLWGSDLFYAIYDEPELLHATLSLISDTYIKFLSKWFEIYPANPIMNPHWKHIYHKGSIVLRSDSAMNLSPDQHREFALPYDSRILKHFGSGAVHFCGRGDHYIEALCSLPEVTGINLSQPEYNNMEKIFQNTVDNGKQILGLDENAIKAGLSRPGGLRGMVSVK